MFNQSRCEPDTYLVLAHTLEFHPPTPSFFDPGRPRLKVMGAYKTEESNPTAAAADVFDQFVKEWASTNQDAQRFYDEITIVQVAGQSAVMRMSDRFGELMRFPNKEAFGPADIYY